MPVEGLKNKKPRHTFTEEMDDVDWMSEWMKRGELHLSVSNYYKGNAVPAIIDDLPLIRWLAPALRRTELLGKLLKGYRSRVSKTATIVFPVLKCVLT